MNDLVERLNAAANGSRGWKAKLFRDAAKAMSARQGQDPKGLGATPASAVGVADLPNSTPETPQVQP